jgi:multidrug efflux pump subunit AcrB
VLAFVPLRFLPGLAGKYIRVLPVTVVVTVLASLFVSLTIIPWLSSLLMREERDEQGNRVLRGLHRLIGATYAPLLGRALAHPRRTLAVAAVLVVASMTLVPLVGFSLFPKAQTPQFVIDIEAPLGGSLAATDSVARHVERELARHPEVRAVLTNVGRDNPQIYYNVIPRNESRRVGQLFVLLHAYDPERTPALLDTLRARFAPVPGARVEVKEFENGPPIDAPIAMRLTGPDLDTLRQLAGRVEGTLRATPGTQYVNNPVRLRRTDLRLAVDRQKAGLLAVPTAEIDRTVRLALAGAPAGVFRDGTEDRDIVVRLPHDGDPTVSALGQVHVPSLTGAQVPLAQVAAVRFTTAEPLIQHHDTERAVTVTAHVRSGFNTDRVTREALARLTELPLPAGYRLTPAGEIESRQESFGGIGSAMIAAVFLILAVLVLEFRTFRSTLIVTSVIPLGVVGGLAALWLTGNTLSFTATIGFVALLGIEIKTSILLVDFTNQLRAEGMPLDEAVQRAGEVRFLPIVLTALTAIGGLLPLALQGSLLYSPLAWVIIGGLVSSTLLARLVTPVLYKLLAPAVG